MNGSETPEPVVTTPVRSASSPSAGHLLLAVVIVLAAGIAAYWNSFKGALVFDDLAAIRDNASIRTLSNVRAVLSPPAGSPTASQPLVNLTLALNYAVGGTEDLWSYHAVNLAIHLLAALTLMGVVRRTLLAGPLVERLGRAALPLGAGVALLWMLHPVQTEAVTYVSQRSQSLAGLLYLLTLYCVIRGAGATKGAGWYLLAVLLCAAGMGTQTLMATAPLTVLIYDRLFLARGWRKAMARRGGLYVGLAATWAILAAVVIAAPPAESLPSMRQYATTQAGVIIQYLSLAVWPVSQSADYAWPWASTSVEYAPQAVMVLILVAATLWGLLRGHGAAMAGVWFFLTLAPSSSVVPQADPIFEHRLYLPLAGLAALAVVGLYAMITSQTGGKEAPTKAPWGLQIPVAVIVLAAAASCGWLTHQRNKVYATPVAFWEAVTASQAANDRHSYRAESQLGEALISAGKVNEGINHLLLAMRVDSDRWEGHYRWASELMKVNRHAEAFGSLRRLTLMRPEWAEPYRMLGECYERTNQPKLALECYEEALKRQPSSTAIQQALGRLKGEKPTEPPTTTRATQPTQPTQPASAP